MAKLDDEHMIVNLDKAYKLFGKRAEEKTDKAVFTCIAEHANPEGKAFVPQNTIADETGYTRRTVSNSIHRLAEKRLLTIEKTLIDNTGTVRGIASNIYHINPKYLIKTKPAQHNTKPQCAACYQGGPHVVPDYLSGWKLVTNDGEHEGVPIASDRTINPRLSNGDVQGLARLGVVMADVLKEIFKLYEEKNKKEESK